MDEQKPYVQLEVWTMFCPRHLEPFKQDWPKGYAIALTELFKYAVAMPAISEHAKNDANNIQAALERFKPICCFVPKEVRRSIIKKALG